MGVSTEPGSLTQVADVGGMPADSEVHAVEKVKSHKLNKWGTETTVMRVKATATRAGFKTPSHWVLIFGWSLAMCAGMVNAVAKETLGTYVSHVTGDTTAIGMRIEGYHRGRHDFETLGNAISVLLSFLFGAFLCGILIDKNQVHLGGKSSYGVALIGNGTLIAASVMVEPPALAACLVAIACGLQNAMCTSHFGAVVRTTHVTGTITDIGSTTGRMAMIFLRKGCRRSRLNVLDRAEVNVDARKLLVLLPMWISFLIGCIQGTYLVRYMEVPEYAMLYPAGFTFSVGLLYTFFRQSFKSFWQNMRKEQLGSDLADVEAGISRSQSYLSGLRQNGSLTKDATLDLDELEGEMGQMLESLRQVEADIQDLRADIASDDRSELSAASQEARCNA